MSKNYRNYSKPYYNKPVMEETKSVVEPEEPVIEKNEEIVYEVSCGEERLNFRNFPGLTGEVRDLLRTGDRLILVQDIGEWCEVKFGSSVGFVMKKYIKKV